MSDKWYRDGLKFKCTGCGGCCTGSPGYTWISEEEIATMAAYLKLSVAEFGRNYLRKINGRYSLLENRHNFDCVFLKDKKCSVYPVRPTQCRTYPWWPGQLRSKKAWEEAAAFCEGINHEEGEIVPFETIEEQRCLQEKST